MIGISAQHFHCQTMNLLFQILFLETDLLASNYPDEESEVIHRDRVAELRVKFQVHGMHGRLQTINPIIADGKAKKLATANWKTTQSVDILQ